MARKALNPQKRMNTVKSHPRERCRAGTVFIVRAGGDIQVGGEVATCIEGQVTL